MNIVVLLFEFFFYQNKKYYCDNGLHVQIKSSKRKGKANIEKQLQKHLDEINHDSDEYDNFIDSIKELCNIKRVCFVYNRSFERSNVRSIKL